MVKTKKETTKEKSKKAEPKKTVKKKVNSGLKTAVKVVAKKIVKPVEKIKVEKTIKEVDETDGEYLRAIGRRKTAVARIRLFTKGKKDFLVNGKKMEDYFTTFELRELCSSALKKMKCFDKFKITVKVSGGGINAQAEAIRHGTARALFLFNPDFKKRLRRVGYLTRDPRRRERKKFGLKRARRAPQWKKR